MQFEIIAEAYRDPERASGRLEFIDRLAALLARTPAESLPTVSHLCQGQIAPEFTGVEICLAEKLATRAIAEAAGVTGEQVLAVLRDTGDLGQAAQRLLADQLAARTPARLAAYDADTDTFPTVCKCGTGFSDADLAALPARLAPLAHPTRPARVDARRAPDVWFEPGLVLEVLGAELTLSPIHTAGRGHVKQDAGLALRFPRFTGRYRDDKAAEDATTVEEVLGLYRAARPVP